MEIKERNLRVAILFDDKAAFVLFNELANIGDEGKAPYTHEVGHETLLGPVLDRFAHRQVTTTNGDDPTVRPWRLTTTGAGHVVARAAACFSFNAI